MNRKQLVSKPPEREIITTDENRKLTAYFHSKKNHEDCISKHQERFRQRIYDKLAVRRLRCVQLVATVLSCLAVAVSPSHAEPTLVDTEHYTLEIFAQFPTDDVGNTKSGPYHLSFDSTGNLFVGVQTFKTFSNQPTDDVYVQKVSPDGTFSNFGPLLRDPDGVLVDIDGRFSEPNSVLVSRIVPGPPPGGEIKVIKESDQSTFPLATSGSGGPLANPQQMAFDSSGRLFVANCPNVAGRPGSVVVMDPSPSPTPRIVYDKDLSSCIRGIAISSDNRIFASVFSTGKVIEIKDSGTATDIITGLSQPDAMAYDKIGIFGRGKPLFFTEGQGDPGQVTHVNPNTKEPEVFATGFGSNDGPLGLAFGPDHCLYIAQHDRNVGGEENNRIWRICHDDDGDDVPDYADNCPLTPNADQTDTDGDGEGDACDDSDNDSVVDASDNCLLTPNTDQADNDLDELGDVCDSDDDNDDVSDGTDNCIFSDNEDQADTDRDGQGNDCDGDDDGDGVEDDVDNCPLHPNAEQTNTDGEDTADACDADDDNDGLEDADDNCPSTVNPNQTDFDADAIGDACDADRDGDGVDDTEDNCPLEPNLGQDDADEDEIGDACDADDDNDNVNDASDNCPLRPNAGQGNADRDSQGDVCDADDDNDGVSDGDDNCPLTANVDQTDTDRDTNGDECDTDDDNDGVSDGSDNCPFLDNPNQSDTDEDGQGDVCDGDDDGDGKPDAADNCTFIANEDQADLDGDTIGDACDADLDGDGKANQADNCPLVANEDQADLDSDDIGNACDADLDGDGKANQADNCPLVINNDQSDLDEDGVGDACDSDIDGDEVLNDPDLCGRTPVDEAVDPITGCSIAQLCPCEGPRGTTERWKNHGQYVSCVARSTGSFVELGLITEAEKGVIVSAAAQSDCGSKK